MASFHTKTFTKHDDYMTPKHVWEDIKQFKVIWECFYGNGTSGTYLRELGFNTIHEDIDFYDNNLGDIILSNPPFSDCKNVMKRLAELDKPFILIMPSSKINTSYFRETFNNKIQIIIPKKRIQFIKLVNGQIPTDYKSCCNFDTFYYCFKIGLKESITWMV